MRLASHKHAVVPAVVACNRRARIAFLRRPNQSISTAHGRAAHAHAITTIVSKTRIIGAILIGRTLRRPLLALAAYALLILAKIQFTGFIRSITVFTFIDRPVATR
mgnify:CR=1 FL=1